MTLYSYDSEALADGRLHHDPPLQAIEYPGASLFAGQLQPRARPPLSGEMSKLGWVLLGAADLPLINLPIDAGITDRVIDTFLDDLRQVATRIRRGTGTAREELRY